MKDVPTPLGSHLEPTHDEATMRRMWSQVQSRRARRTSPWLYATAVGAAAFAVVLLWPKPPPPAAPSVPPAQLRAVDLSATMHTPEVVTTADGSQIVVMPGARLIPLDQSSTTVGWRLERGEASFDVRHAPSRTFFVEAADVRVVVVGTRFRVRRDGARVTVDVDRGEVRVERGDVTAAVTAGHGFDSAPPDVDTPAPKKLRERPAHKATRVAARAALTTPKPVAPAAEPNDPLADADRARAEGRTDDALRILSTFVESNREDPRRGLATFMLARIWMDDRNDPKRAVAAFERAVSIGLPKPLEARALARIVDGHIAIGDRREARAAARRYLERHPNGTKAEQIRRWAEPR